MTTNISKSVLNQYLAQVPKDFESMAKAAMTTHRKELIFWLSAATIAPSNLAYHYSGLNGLLMVATLSLITMAMDIYLSPNFVKNRATANANGFTNSQLYTYMAMNWCIFFPAQCMVLRAVFPTPEVPRFELDVLFKIAFYLVVAEIAFTIFHVRLHREWSHLHLLHHTATEISWSMNFIIHPFDAFIEFSAPAIAVLATNQFIIRDNWSTLMALTIINTWYAMDHDEYLQNPHAIHHSAVTSPYTIYMGTKVSFKDAVRQSLEKVTRLDPIEPNIVKSNRED